MTIESDPIINYLEQYKTIYGKNIYLEDSESIKKSNLDKYFNLIKDCLKCKLGESRNKFVFGVGNPNSKIVFIGEAPGKNEDLKGEPFVGRAGNLLDKILKAISLSRSDVYICNILKCRPPKNRDPLPEEVTECEPFLKEQLSIIQPNLIVALGKIAANTILNNNEQLGAMRNKIHSYQGIDLIATYHPAALLRNPNLKINAWEDFQMIRDKYLINN